MTRRFKTREVSIGKVAIGGNNPIRIQSMTTTNTRDIEATIEQIMRLADVGCEIARVTVQGKKEAEACEGIKSGLVRRGYTIPLVADIHFYPPAALLAVDFVDKVRINPGNFADKRASFEHLDYTEATYAQQLLHIEEVFAPLVEKCKKFKKALRIGTNHGSLSDRIMSRFGDTPYGMVESAFEFTRICRKYDFHDIVYSMKASNPLVMTEAYRLLVARMIEEGWNYPIHLGVTEAGEGEDGRIKSAVGIGSLLLDGIGDTIRVSLTEDPWEEIPPCRQLKALAERYETYRDQPLVHLPKRSKSLRIEGSGLHPQGSVFIKVSEEELLSESFYSDIGCALVLGRLQRGPKCVDALIVDRLSPACDARLSLLRQSGIGVYDVADLSRQSHFIFQTLSDPKLFSGRAIDLNSDRPLILHALFASRDLEIEAAAEIGALLISGIGEGICIDSPHQLKKRVTFSFNLLQACRMRMSKTEYISCPGCGRTLFNLQQVTQKIRDRTGHIPGLKVAVMGCIVNGPGEMADADVGYVGSRTGKVDLYVGKECVQKGIDEAIAVDELVNLIKRLGLWKEAN